MRTTACLLCPRYPLDGASVGVPVRSLIYVIRFIRRRSLGRRGEPFGDTLIDKPICWCLFEALKSTRPSWYEFAKE